MVLPVMTLYLFTFSPFSRAVVYRTQVCLIVFYATCWAQACRCIRVMVCVKGLINY